MYKELLFKIKTLMLMRVIIISAFLGIVLIFQIRSDNSLIISPITSLISLTYLLSICYALILRFVKNLKAFCYVQIFIDVFIEAGIILITGGINSPFPFFFTLSIISGSILLFRPGGYIIASLSSILYGVFTNLELYGLIKPIFIHQTKEVYTYDFVLYNVSLNITAFYIVAYLSGYLAEKLRKTGEELEVKSEDFNRLKTFHENVVDNMGSGLIASDIHGRVISLNKAAETITGYKEEELLGSEIYDTFSLLPRQDSKFLAKGSLLERNEGFFLKKDGSKIYLGITQSLLKDENGNIRGYIMVFQDITDIKNMEVKVTNAERQAALGRVAAGIAHEIRNPLASLSGSIQVLKNRLNPEHTDKRLMDIIIRETERLNKIIVDFLQYASPSPIHLSECSLTDIIEDTVSLLTNHPDLDINKSIRTTHIDGNIAILADSKQLRQVIWNLSLNGIQAMKRGGELEIRTQLLISSSDKKAEIVVVDQGEGMSEKDIPKMFDPFYTTKEDGTGLGLSTVYRIINEHSGEIRVESEKEKGTNITVSLPIDIHSKKS